MRVTPGPAGVGASISAVPVDPSSQDTTRNKSVANKDLYDRITQADADARYPKLVENVAALRLLSPASGQKLHLSGYYLAGDGGGGNLYVDSTDNTSTDNGVTVFVAANGARVKREVPASKISLAAGGCVADGTDQLTKINAVIKALADLGGGVVRVPPRSYWVQVGSLASNKRIQARSNVDLVGYGSSSAIRVLPGSGNYYTVIGPHTSRGTFVENMTIDNFTVDQNPTGNTTSDIRAAGTADQALFAIDFGNYENIRVQHMNFDPCIGVNTVSISAQSGLYAYVEDNFFNWRQGPTTTPDYDNSAVYLTGDHIHARRNVFKSTLAQRARGCVELHGSIGSCHDNDSDWFQTMCNVVSRSGTGVDREKNQLSVHNNRGLNMNHPVVLWPLTGHTLRGVSVHDNEFHVAQIDWNELNCAGLNTTYGTGVEGVLDGFSWADNWIEYQPNDARSVDRHGNALQYAGSAGLLLSRPIDGGIKNGKVKHNTVVNAPFQGSLVGHYHATNVYRHSDIEVDDNTYIDCGQNPNSSAGNHVRTATELRGHLERVFSRRETIKDTGSPTNKGYYSVQTASLQSAVGVYVRDHMVETKSRTGLLFAISSMVRTKAASAPPRPILATGRCYGTETGEAADLANLVATALRMYATPLWVPEARTFDRIGLSVVTASAAGTRMRLGVYEALSNGFPGARILDSGDLLADAAAVKTFDARLLLEGHYMLVCLCESTPTLLGVYTQMANQGMADFSSVTKNGQVYRAMGAYGALPDPFGAITGYLGAAPAVRLRATELGY